MSKRILVIGSINVDYVIHTERLPRLGETLTGSGFSINFGGKGANQAVALAKAGCDVRMLGAIGSDAMGEQALEHLRTCGVDTSCVLRTDAPTGAAVITVCGGNNHILLDIGANACVTPEVIAQNEALFDWADAIVMQYEIPIESVLAAAQMARAKGVRVILNPAPVQEVPPALYGLVALIIPNDFEAALITGIEPTDADSARRAIDALLSLGCASAVLTLGENGSAYSTPHGVSYAGIYRTACVDTTAAGDSFIGGLCVKLCADAPMEDAVAYAAAVAGITVSRRGASQSIPSAAEVTEFLRSRRIEPSPFA